jgi:Helix-turn-helix domain
MSLATALPNHLRPCREKCFGDGRPRSMDRNAKVRVMTFARALMRRTEPSKHYGAITAKAMALLEVLLWGFHNARNGLCFPSYETIAAKAGCARLTVAEAIKALEDAGVLTWGQPDHAHPGAGTRLVQAFGDQVACDPHQQRLQLFRSAPCAARGFLWFWL